MTSGRKIAGRCFDRPPQSRAAGLALTRFGAMETAAKPTNPPRYETGLSVQEDSYKKGVLPFRHL
jgi:hypothetical protein